MRRTAVAVAACAFALGSPAAAGAATTVGVEELPDGGVVRVKLTIRGDDGPNRVGYSRELGAVIVRDLAGVVPGTGCAAVEGEAGTAARCVLNAPADVTGTVEGGAGDDLLALSGLFDGTAIVDGGPGDDLVEGDGTLRGGPGADILRGGLRGDLLDGGPGPDAIDGGGERAGNGLVDHVDYRSRTGAIRVDLAGGGEVGEAGEGDRLNEVEGILAGSGNDVLTGSPDEDVLDGGAGDDRLSGGDGDDRLHDSQDGALLEGGAGDDVLETTSLPLSIPGEGDRTEPVSTPGQAAILRGGPGRDTLSSGRGADDLDPGPGVDVVRAGGTTPDSVDLRDGGFDSVECFNAARVRADGPDLAPRCRRVRRAGTARPWLVSVRGAGPVRSAGTAGVAEIACAHARGRCRGILRVEVAGLLVGRRGFSVPRATKRALKVALEPWVARAVRRDGAVRALFEISTRDAAGRTVRQRRAMRFCAPGSSGCDA